MPETISLSRFQHWMLEVVTHFGSDDEAWSAEAATRRLSRERALDNVLPSATLNAVERIGIYRTMYFLRMRDALELDAPAVARYIGREAFERVVEDYFTRYPSASYTLNDTGLLFPRYLRESLLPDREFLAELAELHLAVARVMDAEETPPVAPERLASVPPVAWSAARFRGVAALELCAFAYPVQEYLSAFENESSVYPAPVLRPNYAYIHRADYSTRHYALISEEFRVLQALLQGAPLAQALEIALQETSDEMFEEMQSRVTARFQEWILKGLFADILF